MQTPEVKITRAEADGLKKFQVPASIAVYGQMSDFSI